MKFSGSSGDRGDATLFVEIYVLPSAKLVHFLKHHF